MDPIDLSVTPSFDPNSLEGWIFSGNTGVDTRGGSSGGFNWNAFSSIFTPIARSAGNILGTRYAVPQLNPGQLIQGNGMLLYQGANGSTMPSISSLTGGGSSSMLLIGGVALVVVVMMMKK